LITSNAIRSKELLEHKKEQKSKQRSTRSRTYIFHVELCCFLREIIGEWGQPSSKKGVEYILHEKCYLNKSKYPLCENLDKISGQIGVQKAGISISLNAVSDDC
jgi:hypothetical protein